MKKLFISYLLLASISTPIAAMNSETWLKGLRGAGGIVTCISAIVCHIKYEDRFESWNSHKKFDLLCASLFMLGSFLTCYDKDESTVSDGLVNIYVGATEPVKFNPYTAYMMILSGKNN